MIRGSFSQYQMHDLRYPYHETEPQNWRTKLNTKSRIYLYKVKLPLSIFPLILFVLIFLAVLAILGLFIGVILGAAMLGFIVLRLLISSKKKQAKPVEENGQTIILKEGDYKVIEKK